ncbi:MAG: low-specificity L-threonine aldolase [Deltaproteobacteria bacterium]|nr:low-specificity L-threonine aldolase [Deltaproteobacteria bacterium]
MNDKTIDLRSDTVTKPTLAMRQAMAEAEVGDDVLGDDPTVKALERRTAELLGKDAAVFVPSGTMANQLAIRCNTEPGDEMLLDANAHIYWYEAGASAALSGVICRTLLGVRGIFSSADVRAALRPIDVHFPPTRLLSIENTHNRGGGSIWPLEEIQDVCSVARESGIRTHLDGARLWNASVATGIPESEYAKDFDSVSVCFSKGLGAPVGSALVGNTEFVESARRFRKQFGGGMRQAGIIASGALYALVHHRERLADDHENAKRLASGLREIPGIHVSSDTIDTNMVYFDVERRSAMQLTKLLKEMNVLVLSTGKHTIRAVTSLAVDVDDIFRTIDIVRNVSW